MLRGTAERARKREKKKEKGRYWCRRPERKRGVARDPTFSSGQNQFLSIGHHVLKEFRDEL